MLIDYLSQSTGEAFFTRTDLETSIGDFVEFIRESYSSFSYAGSYELVFYQNSDEAYIKKNDKSGNELILEIQKFGADMSRYFCINKLDACDSKTFEEFYSYLRSQLPKELDKVGI
jgi:hypothetical protein